MAAGIGESLHETVACDPGDSAETESQSCEDFVRKDRDGKWYSFSEFFKYYGPWRFPDRKIPGNWKTVQRLKVERALLQKRVRSGVPPLELVEHLEKNQRSLNENMDLYGKRKNFVIDIWIRSEGLTQSQCQALNSAIWSWQHRALDRGHEEEEDADWPYQEDCYPIGCEDLHSFYQNGA